MEFCWSKQGLTKTQGGENKERATDNLKSRDKYNIPWTALLFNLGEIGKHRFRRFVKILWESGTAATYGRNNL